MQNSIPPLSTLMKLLSYVCLVPLLTACPAIVHESYAQDGRKAYSLSCSGKFRTWDACFTAAGETCGPAGYDILDKTSEKTENLTFTVGVGGDYSLSHMRTMLIACKPGLH